MKFTLAIFDLDGTLLNTLEDLVRCTNYALSVNALPVRKAMEVRQFTGNGIHTLIERAVPAGTDEKTLQKVFGDFTENYREHCMDNTCPYHGIIDLLKNLKKRGIKLAVISNKADFAVQDLCSRFFPGIFDAVYGERPDIRRKPAPDAVNEVLQSLKVEKSAAVYIGDSEVDVETAKNAGLDLISVLWGFREKENLISCGAKNFAANMEELENLITA